MTPTLIGAPALVDSAMMFSFKRRCRPPARRGERGWSVNGAPHGGPIQGKSSRNALSGTEAPRPGRVRLNPLAVHTHHPRTGQSPDVPRSLLIHPEAHVIASDDHWRLGLLLGGHPTSTKRERDDHNHEDSTKP